MAMRISNYIGSFGERFWILLLLDIEGAKRALERALTDDPHYSLAHLLQKTFAAGWPPEAFTTMRHQLHPKLEAELLG